MPSATDALAIIKYRLGKTDISQTYQKFVTVSTYHELCTQLSQANTNITFDTSTEEGKQTQEEYNTLKKIVDTYCTDDMWDITKALVLHDYLVAGTELEHNLTTSDPVKHINGKLSSAEFADCYSCLLGIAGIPSKIVSNPLRSYAYNQVNIDGEIYYISCGSDKLQTDNYQKNEVLRFNFLRNGTTLGSSIDVTQESTSTKYYGVEWPKYRKELDYKNSEIKLQNLKGKTVVRTMTELKKALMAGKDYVVDVIDTVSLETKEVDERCKKVIDKFIKPGMSIEEKLLTIHDYICSNFLRTSSEAYQERTIKPTDYDCAWGRYKNVVLSNVGDCWLSTSYFNTLCAYIGVETKSVSEGDVVNPFGLGNHMWSLVKLDGKWYHVDCEGGDYYEYGEVSRRWFLNSDKGMGIIENNFEPCTSTKYDGYEWPTFKGVAYYQDLTGIQDEKVPATGLWIQETTSATVGENYPLLTRVYPYGSTSKVQYSSNNPAVASIDSLGNIKVKTPGSTVITAQTDNGITKQFTLTCTYPLKNIIPDDMTLTVGETKKITYKMDPVGAIGTITGWTIKDSSIAKVDKEGNVTALKQGTTTIYCNYRYRVGRTMIYSSGKLATITVK